MYLWCRNLRAQTLKETIRGKYGEYQGTAETRMSGGKAVTVGGRVVDTVYVVIDKNELLKHKK